MTAVISGTNGLLQSYDYQVLTTGFTYTFAAGTQVLVMNPAGTLATGTITMPASPADGMTITFSTSQQITALTMAGNGASINNAVTFLPAKTAVAYVYRATGTTWWPVQSVPGTGSQLVQGTSVATTSGTTVDFTGIPSWVKRITLMLQGVSSSGGSDFLVRLGSGATPTYVATGYLGNRTRLETAAMVTAAVTTGFDISVNNAASGVISGQAVLSNFGGNNWVCTATTNDSANNTQTVQSGSLALGAVLTAVRLTPQNGTDTFDAGSINILYE